MEFLYINKKFPNIFENVANIIFVLEMKNIIPNNYWNKEEIRTIITNYLEVKYIENDFYKVGQNDTEIKNRKLYE